MSEERIKSSVLRHSRTYGINLHPRALKYLVETLSDISKRWDNSSFENFLKEQLDLLFTVIEQDFQNLDSDEENEALKSKRIITEEFCRRILDSTRAEATNSQAYMFPIDRKNSEDNISAVSSHVTSIMVGEVPPFLYDHKLKKWGKEKIKTPLAYESSGNNIHPSILLPESRFDIVHHRLLRHPLFEHISLKAGATAQKDFGKEKFVLVSQLPRTNRENIVFVFGIITKSLDGKCFLEDSFAKQPLVFDESSKISSHATEGYVLSHAPIIVKAQWDGTYIHSFAIGLPPGEPRLLSQQWLGQKVDLFGKRSASYSLDHRIEKTSQILELSTQTSSDSSHADPTMCLIFSDFLLDDAEALHSFRSAMKLLLARRGCVLSFATGEKFVPTNEESLIFVFCGNFLKVPNLSMDISARYREAFYSFGEILEKEFPLLSKVSSFYFVPGPDDLTQRGQNKVFPKSKLPQVFTAELQKKIPNATMATNPLRLRVCDKEIIIFRDDCTMKMETESVLPNSAIEDSFQEGLEVCSFTHVVKTIFDNSHLYPFRRAKYPVYPSEDASLRLFPLPDTLVLCDHSLPESSATSSYLECRAINPGSFGIKKRFTVLHPKESGYSLTDVQNF